MDMSKLVGLIVALWVVGVLVWMWYTMHQGFYGVSQLQVIRVRIATVIGGLVSILLLYGNAMLTW
ncbi:MAG: hypothetical protein P4L77_11710 [Sulfuriferula sp.]|nr:hypothetical protein [Sulfuriferula sp.]